jgi:hypothetical protein
MLPVFSSLLSGYKIPVFSTLQERRQADLDCHLLQAPQNGLPDELRGLSKAVEIWEEFLPQGKVQSP